MKAVKPRENAEIRAKMALYGVTMTHIAEYLDTTASTISRRLAKPLDDYDTDQYLSVIDLIAANNTQQVQP